MEEVHSLYVLVKVFIVRTFLGNPSRNYLMGCFKEAEWKMVGTFSQTNLPKKVLSDLWKQLWLLYKAYLHAFDWFKKYNNHYAVYNEKKLDFADDEHYNSTFLLPSGEFDDTKWVRKFVKDPQNPISARFYIACSYCLESEIRMLWQVLLLDENYPRYRQRDFHKIWIFDPELVAFWIFYIEGKENEYMQREIEIGNSMLLNRSFMFCGMKMAFDCELERAVYYFWGKISAEERNTLLSDIPYYAKLLTGTGLEDGKIIDFFFSKMNVHQQLLVLQCDVEENKQSVILNSYVYSKLHKLLEIIEHHHNLLPPTAFSGVLELIIMQIKESPYNNHRLVNPYNDADNNVYDYENLFIQIWCLGSPIEKDYVFNNNLCILETLFVMKQFRSIAVLLKDSAFECDLLSRQELGICVKLATNTDCASNPSLFMAMFDRFERMLKLSHEHSWFSS